MVNLKVYDIIKGTMLSKKTKQANDDEFKIIIEVHINANKIQIKEAVSILFGAKVLSVNVIVSKGKNKKSSGRYIYKEIDRKKAIVKIKKDESSMNIFSQQNENFSNDLNSGSNN